MIFYTLNQGIMVAKEVGIFYINSSIHVSLAIVSLTLVTLINFKVPLDKNFLLFVFCASITGYNFVKYAGIAKLRHRSLARNLRFIQIFSFIAFLGLLYTLFFLPVFVIILAGILGLFTLLYALPVFPGNNNLRGISGMKIYIIALVWAGATVLLPLVQKMNFFQWDTVITLIQRFCLVFSLTIPFEIRDLRYDMAQLQTIPQRMGVVKSRVAGILCIYAFVMLEFLKETFELATSLSVIGVGVLAVVLIKHSKINQSKYYASFWVEGVPIFWLMILIAINLIIY